MKPIDVTPADYTQMVDLFNGETDRGAAVLAGSYIENYLGIFLQACMVDASLSERVFGSNGALSTFSQRIDFAQAFGFLPKVLCDDLRLIKKIRNHFAHHPKEASFTSSPVREWIASLQASNVLSMIDGGTFRLDDARAAYLVSVGMVMFLANNKLHGYGNPEV